jgi:multiple sugar transport system substrate-binding protein
VTDRHALSTTEHEEDQMNNHHHHQVIRLGTTDRWRASRRQFLAAGGAAAALAMLGPVGSRRVRAGSGGTEVLVTANPTNEEIVRRQADRFNEAHPDGPTISVQATPMDTDEYFAQLRTQFQAGGGDIDVIAGDVIWPAQLAEPGWIVDLSDRFTEELQAEFLPGTVAAMKYGDSIWGVPWYTDSGLLYYRADLLETAGFSAPPATWAELSEMAAKILADSGVQSGFVFTGAIYEGGTVLGTEFIRNAGGDILDGDTVVIGSDAAITGLTAQRALVAEGIAPEAVANFREDEVAGAFLRGDAVFMRTWPYVHGQLSDSELSTLEVAQVGLAKLPVVVDGVESVNVGGGWNYYINAATDNEDAAWEVIEFLSAAEQQREMAIEGSFLPTRTSVYDDPEVLETMPAVALGKEAFLTTTTPPVSPYYADMSAAMAEQFNANILGDTSPEDAAAAMQEALESIIERGG